MSNLAISGRQLGSRKPLFADWSVTLPPERSSEGGLTLRRLIEVVVRSQVQEFRERQIDRQTLRVLTSREITAGAARGRVAPGLSEVPSQEVDEEAAVVAAWQAFTDGLYLVVVDEQDQRDLDREVFLNPESRVTFVRLALLAGG